MAKKNDWMSYMRNPQSWIVKKYMYEILKEKFADHESFVDRIANSLQNQEDIENWSKLVAEIYETGFLKAVNEYQTQVEDKGFKVNIIPGYMEPPKNNKPIFNQDQKNQAES